MDENAALMKEWVPQLPNYATNGSSSFGSYHSTGTDNAKQGSVFVESGVTLNRLPDVEQSGGGLSDRIAARNGFNAPQLNTEVNSPYITIPPGIISPTALLESPVFLSNSLTQASPTTGKFPFFPNDDLRGNAMVLTEQSKEDFFEDVDGSTFAFKPHLEPSFLPFSIGTSSKTNQVMNTLQNLISSQSELPQTTTLTETRCIDTISSTAEHSPPLSDQQDDDDEQQAADDDTLTDTAGVEDDGYNWRKYGQKQVKGSEFPRSYFKCTHMTCPVKKKVERSREGHLTEIIYTGEHNHPKPVLNRRPSTCFNQFDDSNGVENGHHQWSNNESSELRRSSPPLHIWNGARMESGEAVDPSSTFSNDDENVSATVGSASIANDVQEDESESKRRKVETLGAEIGSGATRAIREPRVVVQTASDVDILDDGYRWRKYGQKVVKGNPNPRSYYKCTSVGCTVRKHVERASNDLKSVITTYEGKHNHDVPPARNSSHVNTSTTAAGFASQTQSFIQRSETSQVNNMGRYERGHQLNSFIMPMMQQQQQQQHQQPLIHHLHQPSLTNFSMAGLGTGQSKFPGMMPVHHPYLMQQQQMQQRQATDIGGITMPKGERNSDPNLYISNGTSVYHQVVNRLPLGP